MEANNSVNKIIGQFRFAKSEFPELLQINLYEYSISFGEVPNLLTFKIYLPNDYPYSPPQIYIDSQPIPIPFTKQWCPLFQLKHIIQLLQMYHKYSFGEVFLFSQAEINQIDQSTDINEITTIQSAQKHLNMLQESLKTCQQNLQDTHLRIVTKTGKLNETHHTLIDLNSQLYGPEQELKSKQRKIESLRKLMNQSKDEVKRIASTFNIDQSDDFQYLQNSMDAKEKKIYFEVLADAITRMTV